ncbi:hypothetical protein B9Z35_02955 [Limnohabitans sp. Jir61]|jgi:hypothetical protein|uniref:hypothetical protein n=1 Tax=Limnohabitans sp. Jir61 TaxID=1826168 RepID=UPI000D386E97|nr:hypothetical protein [Limnohabitans sp. Jir61]PUE32512.1 hypothetical protein B9Z35_02955 [Limnohabitans sp. Jir61]
MAMFLNVFPKRIWATLNPEGVFEGQMTFNLEQYGLVLTDSVCDLTIAQDSVIIDQWKIFVKPIHSVDMPHFDQFVKALNSYVFDVLKFQPSKSATGNDLPMVKLFFDGIYFDMSGVEPVVQKIPTAPSQK